MYYIIANNKNLISKHLDILNINQKDTVVFFNKFNHKIYKFVSSKTNNIIIFLRQNCINDNTFFGDYQILKSNINVCKIIYLIHDDKVNKKMKEKIKLITLHTKSIPVINYLKNNKNIFNKDFNELKIIPSLGLFSIYYLLKLDNIKIKLVGFTQRKQKDNKTFKSKIHNSQIEKEIIKELVTKNIISEIYQDLY